MHCREKIFSTFKDYLFLFLRHSTPASAAFIPGTFLTFFYHFSERSASTFFWKKKTSLSFFFLSFFWPSSVHPKVSSFLQNYSCSFSFTLTSGFNIYYTYISFRVYWLTNNKVAIVSKFTVGQEKNIGVF